MSRIIYDNWEKLVVAVLKKQQFWELCHAESRTPSTCSETYSNPSSVFQPNTSPLIDHQPVLPFSISEEEDGIGLIITVVLKMELHCECCAESVRRIIQSFEGVQNVTTDFASHKVTVTGNVNPIHLQERTAFKTNKKVEILSPRPEQYYKINQNSAADKKRNQPAPSIAVLKMRLHCEECVVKIRRIIMKNVEGVTSLIVDSKNELVTVIGAEMDLVELQSYLKTKLKRNVYVVTPEKRTGGTDQQANEGDGGGEKKKDSDDEHKFEPKNAGHSRAGASGAEQTKVELNKTGNYPSRPHSYNVIQPTICGGDSLIQQLLAAAASSASYAVQGPPPPLHPRPAIPVDTIFSDENPNAYCSMM